MTDDTVEPDRGPLRLPRAEPTGPASISVSGIVRVALPPADAFGLFTPSGERAWAEGWSPRFPAQVDDETAPGTVFQTQHSGRLSTWVVTGCEPGRRITYARTAFDRAGLVSVECGHAPGGSTQALVAYTLTATRDGARPCLAKFAAGYEAFLEHWEQAISRHLQHAR
jgi:hypothetical protein